MSDSVDRRLREVAEVGEGRAVGFGPGEVMAAGAAVARTGDEPPRWRRPLWRRPAIVVLALVVALGGVAIGVAVTRPAAQKVQHPAGGPTPVVDTALTPPSWYPVMLGDYQISAPHSWIIEAPNEDVCGGDAVGMVFVSRPVSFPSAMRCKLARNVVTMQPVMSLAPRDARRSVLNAIWVERWTTGSWPNVVHELSAAGITVAAQGPYAGRILATLTYSPLAVVVDRARLATPSSWQRVSVGGVGFAVPADWQVRQGGPGCGPAPESPDSVVVADLSSASAGSCGGYLPTVGYLAARPGVFVETGKYANAPMKPSACRPLSLGRTMCVHTGSESVGNVTVTIEPRPHDHTEHKVVLHIGLYGSGLVAKEIFDSIHTSTGGTQPPASVACQSSSLSLRAGSYGEAGGQFSWTLILTSHATRPCRLGGWPQVMASESSANLPEPTTTTRVRQTAPPAPASRMVILQPDGTASFDIYGPDWNAVANTACAEARAVLVVPPGNGASVGTKVRFPWCGRLYISPIIPGTRDRIAWSSVVG